MSLLLLFPQAAFIQDQGGSGISQELYKKRKEQERIFRIQKDDEGIFSIVMQFLAIIEEDDEWDRLLAA